MPRMTSQATTSMRKTSPKEPRFQGWKTSDDDEIERRRWRGRTEPMEIVNREPVHGHFGTFDVSSESGRTYSAEIRDLGQLNNSCTCNDFETGGLGTCKHIESVLFRLRSDGQARFNQSQRQGSRRVEVFLSGQTKDVQIAYPLIHGNNQEFLAGLIEPVVDQLGGKDPMAALVRLREIEASHPEGLRASRLLEEWATKRQRRFSADRARAEFIDEVEAGRESLDLMRYPLFPYQRDGVIHLAFGERALLADEMGLGKTFQAIAACVLLQKLQSVERVLVVSPASLKAEWAEQIEASTGLSCQTVFGRRESRLQQYMSGAFFTLTNYEQIFPDADEIQQLLDPDIVILDEAQRIKNWRTRTASSVKRLKSRYAFVLTGTPLENRIDELYSIVQFLDPSILGPLFRFNRDYYLLDDRGRPMGYQNLDQLRERVRPIILRRRKDEVEDDLPERTVNNFFLDMTEEQEIRYRDLEKTAASIANKAKRRPLSPDEFQRLQTALACMRMTCDTPYILDPDVRDCPKLDEFERVLEDLLSDEGRKVIVFSEWVRMLELVRERLDEMDLDYAWHTGSVPQNRRRAEINRFKQDPNCKVFLSSESGGVGLNLQVASAVINLDLPWNPAKLEQRIARAWRKNQTRSVSVINLVTRDSIEHRMLGLLDYKQALSDSVLDGRGDTQAVQTGTGRAAFLERLEKVMGKEGAAGPRWVDPVEATVKSLREEFDQGLQLVELRKTDSGKESILAVMSGSEVPDTAALDVKGGPQVEFISQETLDAIRKLEALGHLSFSAGSMRVLFEAERNDEEPPDTRREDALTVWEKADKQYRMAKLLADGGFAAETLPQVAEMTRLCLTALATLVPADGGNGADEESAAQICDRLGGTDALPSSLRFKALWMSEVGKDGSEGTDGEEALAGAAGLLSHVRAAISA